MPTSWRMSKASYDSHHTPKLAACTITTVRRSKGLVFLFHFFLREGFQHAPHLETGQRGPKRSNPHLVPTSLSQCCRADRAL